jgi:hypothetical protein
MTVCDQRRPCCRTYGSVIGEAAAAGISCRLSRSSNCTRVRMVQSNVTRQLFVVHPEQESEMGQGKQNDRARQRSRSSGMRTLLLTASLPRKPHHRPELQHVLLPDLRLILLLELARELLAPRNVLRADKVDRDFDAVGHVCHLDRDEFQISPKFVKRKHT